MNIMTTVEAAEYVRLGKATLERWRCSGQGPIFIKLGGAVRYRQSDLDEWLESNLKTSS